MLADGRKLYDSGLVTRDDAIRSFSVDVTGAKVLTLLVGDAGDGGFNDRADWVDLRAGGGAPPATVPEGPWSHFLAHSAKSATASSSNRLYPPGNAIDGKLTTLWHSEFSPVRARCRSPSPSISGKSAPLAGLPISLASMATPPGSSPITRSS